MIHGEEEKIVGAKPLCKRQQHLLGKCMGNEQKGLPLLYQNV